MQKDKILGEIHQQLCVLVLKSHDLAEISPGGGNLKRIQMATRCNVPPKYADLKPGAYSIAPQICGRVSSDRKLPLPQILVAIEQLYRRL